MESETTQLHVASFALSPPTILDAETEFVEHPHTSVESHGYVTRPFDRMIMNKMIIQ